MTQIAAELLRDVVDQVGVQVGLINQLMNTHRLNPNPQTFGSFRWLSYRAMAVDAELRELYEFVAGKPLLGDSEMVVRLRDGAVTTH